MLRLAVELRPQRQTDGAVLVTSPHQGDGKSTIAANFAMVSALTRNRVLLIDGDLHDPTQYLHFGLKRSPGIVELIRDDLPLSKAVQHSGYFGLDVLTSGGAIARPGDVAGSAQMGALIDAARQAYDVVVVDSPPVLLAADAASMASREGVGVLLVVRRQTKRRHLANAVRKLSLSDATLLGLVVNREGRIATYGY